LWKEYIPIFIVAFILLSGIANASVEHLSPSSDRVCSNNVCTLTLYSGPKNYWNGSVYEPINNTIYEVNRNYYGYSFTYGNEHGLYDTYFYDSSPISVFRKGNHALIQTSYAVGWFDTSSNDYGLLETVQESLPILNNNIVTYPDIFYGMNVTYEYQNDRLKETIIISEDTKNYITTHYPNIPSPETKWFIVANKLDFVNINMADKGVKIVNPKTVTGRLEFRDNLTEDLKFFLPISWAWDSTKNESCDVNSTNCFDVKWRIIKYGDNWYVLYGVPLTWFADKQFPIYIDPTVKLQNNETENLADIHAQDSTTTPYGMKPQLKWNISSVPTNQILKDATLCLYILDVHNGSSLLDNDVKYHRIDNQTWDESISTTDFDALPETNSTLTTLSAVTPGNWACINVTNAVETDYNLGNENTTIRIEDPDASWDGTAQVINELDWLIIGGVDASYNIDYFKFASRENETASVRPYLNITYEIPNSPPSWSSNTSSVPSSYSPSTYSWFNVTWNDDNDENGYNYSVIELNGVNYTTSRDGNVSYYKDILGAGTYTWKFYANDSSNEWNSTDEWSKTISKQPVTLSLLLNATYLHTTDALNITAVSNSSDTTIYLTTNYTAWGTKSGNTKLENVTTYSSEGIYEANLYITDSANYTFTNQSATFYIDDTPPSVTSYGANSTEVDLDLYETILLYSIPTDTIAGYNQTIIEVTYPNTTITNYTSLTGNLTIPINWTSGYGEGNYTIKFYTQDKADNWITNTTTIHTSKYNITYTFKVNDYKTETNPYTFTTNQSHTSLTSTMYINIKTSGTATLTKNLSINLTSLNYKGGDFSVTELLNTSGSNVTYSLSNGILTYTTEQMSGAVNIYNNATINQSNALYYTYYPDGLYYIYKVQPNFTDSDWTYSKILMPSSHWFDPSEKHIRYWVCIGTVTGSSCSQYSSAIDVTYENEGNNGATNYDVNLKTLGTSTNKTYLLVNSSYHSPFLIEAIPVTGSELAGSGTNPPGGGSAPPPSEEEIPTNETTEPCPPGYELITLTEPEEINGIIYPAGYQMCKLKPAPVAGIEEKFLSLKIFGIPLILIIMALIVLSYVFTNSKYKNILKKGKTLKLKKR